MSDCVSNKKVLGKSLIEIIKENKIEYIKGLNFKPKKPITNNKKRKQKKII